MKRSRSPLVLNPEMPEVIPQETSGENDIPIQYTVVGIGLGTTAYAGRWFDSANLSQSDIDFLVKHNWPYLQKLS